MKKKKLHPIHPGEVLLEEFLKPMGLSQNKLALNISMPAQRINEIILEKERSLLIKPSDFHGSSKHPQSSGLDCSLNTTLILLPTHSVRVLREKSGYIYRLHKIQ